MTAQTHDLAEAIERLDGFANDLSRPSGGFDTAHANDLALASAIRTAIAALSSTEGDRPLALIAQGWTVLESDGRHMAIAPPEGWDGPEREMVIDSWFPPAVHVPEGREYALETAMMRIAAEAPGSLSERIAREALAAYRSAAPSVPVGGWRDRGSFLDGFQAGLQGNPIGDDDQAEDAWRRYSALPEDKP